VLTAILLPLASITGLGKTVLALVAATFIIWALVTAISIPKRNPSFPRNLGVYLTITAVLFAGQMAAVVWVTGTQEVEKAAHEESAGGGGEATTTEGTETTATETTETTATEETTTDETTTSEETTTEETTATEADLAAGKEIFSGSCASCHTLADAGASGSVGPNLDDSQPPLDLVVDRVTNGRGGMPAFSGQLDEQQIQDVSAYVASVAGA
jgi:mono/diheme cytochrome c family protein